MHIRKSSMKQPRKISVRSRSTTPIAKTKNLGPNLFSQRQHRKKQYQQKQKLKWLAEQKRRRERWGQMAEETRRIVLGDGKYVEERPLSSASTFVSGSISVSPLLHPGSPTVRILHNISAEIQLSIQGTTFYPHYSPLLASWKSLHGSRRPGPTQIEFVPTSAPTAAYSLSHTHPSLHKYSSLSSLPRTTLGVLSFASPKKPGGGFLHGGDEQEEIIARSSSLVASLGASESKHFYQEHRKFLREDGSGLHDHSMVYSPGVVIFRSDEDESQFNATPPTTSQFISPYTVNIISAVPVNAAAVRSRYLITDSDREIFESGIRHTMYERMARILHLFEVKGERSLVLGAFGCGSSQNRVAIVAECWAELLVCGHEGSQGEARFKDVFETIVFAVPGKLYEPFKKAFEMRVFEADVTHAVTTE